MRFQNIPKNIKTIIFILGRKNLAEFLTMFINDSSADRFDEMNEEDLVNIGVIYLFIGMIAATIANIREVLNSDNRNHDNVDKPSDDQKDDSIVWDIKVFLVKAIFILFVIFAVLAIRHFLWDMIIETYYEYFTNESKRKTAPKETILPLKYKR